ncbi:MAG: endopeptidase La [Oscillospiraceae bacterium]|nr:endopeptidase La [Oscillospiraceae bacterium]
MEPVTRNIPALALRGLVVYPNTTVSLDLERTLSIRALERAMETGRELFAVTQRELLVDTPSLGDLYAVGTLVRVTQALRVSEDALRIVVEGVQRARLRRLWQKEPFLQAQVELLDEPEPARGGARTEALVRQTCASFGGYVELTRNVSAEALAEAFNTRDPARLADLIAHHASLRYQDKMIVLEELRPLPRLRLVNEILLRETEVVALEQEIEGKARGRMGRIHRDFILREQIKVLQHELGEGEDGEELDAYRDRILALRLPEETEKKLLKDVGRLSKQQFGSAEASVLRAYLDTVLELPWNRFTKERADVVAARKILERDHFGMEKVKERVLEFIAVRARKPDARGQALCLVGPPGVGKTSVALSVAKATNRKVARLSLGGVRDEADIRGHRKTYVGAMPGRIVEAIGRSGSMNPLLVLDEVDKLGADHRGDPASALLEVLDAAQNHAFRDHYLEIPLDLSRVLFLMTANTTDTIPRALLDRMEVIELPSYTDEEKVQIALRHLLPKQRAAHALPKPALRIDERALRAVISGYTRESGVRELERQLAKLCRKAAMALNDGTVKHITVTEENLSGYLGAPRCLRDRAPKRDLVGVVNGLAWTSAGGELLNVEANVMDGSGKLELTGNLGDVMRESCHAALSFLRARARELGIAADFYKTKDIHVHFPDGATPKDGPSAGVAVATAMLSALPGRPVRRDVAMTGEVTLRGRVLPIGGLREKTMAALRAGIHTVVIPKENEKDLDEIDPRVREKLRFVTAETVDAVFAEALALPEAAGAQKLDAFLDAAEFPLAPALRV